MESIKKHVSIGGEEFFLEDFQNMTPQEQIDKMREWFYEHYEDPVERTPYESREGGYIFIWGGPYEANDELSVFGDLVEDELIEQLADELSDICYEWTKRASPDDYDNSYMDAYLLDSEYFLSFNNVLTNINIILQSEITGHAKEHLLGLLYINVITAIETYLSDAFIHKVFDDKSCLRKLVESNPEFTKQSFNLSEVFTVYDAIEIKVKKYLLGLMWHNIKKIKPMYKVSLGVDFPEDLSPLFKAIAKRHDLVHRGGKNKDGEPIDISEEELRELVVYANTFVGSINEQIDIVYDNNAC